MDSITQIPSAASWGFSVAQAPDAQIAWQTFSRSLRQLGFANVCYFPEIERFKPALPPDHAIYGYLVSPQWMAAVRSNPLLRNAGYKVPAAASMGLEAVVIPEREITNPALEDAQRAMLDGIWEYGLAGGWTFPLVDRQSNTYSLLAVDCCHDLADHEHLVDQHRQYLRTSNLYFREGLVIQQIAHELGPDFLSVRERDCLAWTTAGKSTKEIARQLGIADSTVNEYIGHAQKKLKAGNRTQAAARAMLLGAITP